MKRKKELKQGIWIEDDLTKEEREIQKKTKREGEGREGERKQDEGRMKIFIGENVYRWNKKKRKLNEEGRRT